MNAGPLHRPGRLWLAAGVLLLLAACDVKLPGNGPPPRLFTLDPKIAFASDLPEADWQLVIETPSAPESLDSARIAIQRTPIELDYYAGVAWMDRVPSMVQTLLLAAFERSGKIVAVGRDATGLRADYMLKTDIRDFEAENGSGNPTPHVRIVAKLIKMPARQIVADHICDEKKAASADTLERVVETYNDVLGRCLQSVVEWTLKTGTSRNRGG